MLVETGLAKYELIINMVKVLFEPWGRHRTLATQAEFQKYIGKLCADYKAKAGSEPPMISMAEQEPVIWRHDFDGKNWTTFVDAQNDFMQSLQNVMIYISLDSPALSILTDAVGKDLNEFATEIIGVLEELAPLVSQAKTRVRPRVIQLPSSLMSTPVQIAELAVTIQHKIDQLLSEHRNYVVSNPNAILIENAAVFPILGLSNCLCEIAANLERLWHATYESYSRHRFED